MTKTDKVSRMGYTVETLVLSRSVKGGLGPEPLLEAQAGLSPTFFPPPQ